MWPENWPIWEVFARVQTQWRISFSGATGLDYSAVYPLLDRLTSDPDEWQRHFDDLRTMEAAALEQMRSQS